MSTLDEIYSNRLEKIRTDLDSYLHENILSEPISTASCFKCAEPIDDDDFFCDEEEVSETSLNIPDFLVRGSKYEQIDQALNQKKESFSEMLLRLIDEKGLKDSDVYKSANIDRRLFSKIRGDADYMPSKKTAISFCMALQLAIDETEELLKAAGYSLSMSSRFDLIIRYLIENKEYNIHFANIVLDDYGEGTLSR